jgi:hypothetical protein
MRALGLAPNLCQEPRRSRAANLKRIRNLFVCTSGLWRFVQEIEEQVLYAGRQAVRLIHVRGGVGVGVTIKAKSRRDARAAAT